MLLQVCARKNLNSTKTFVQILSGCCQSMSSSHHNETITPKIISPYPYQVEILQKAKKNNTIVCLGTGTGKTFISVMLIKDKQNGICDTLKMNGKRTVFLVNTVPLVFQQAQVIRDNTDLKVGEYTGDRGVDFWDKNVWCSEFNDNDVLVMTAQILYNILTHKFFKLSNINLLILDECHNATGKHPYSMILKMFNDEDVHRHPHVLGLTASIINQKYTGSEDDLMITTFLERKMKELEGRMRAACATCSNFDATEKYAAKPIELVQSYTGGYDVNEFVGIDKLIKSLLQKLEDAKALFKDKQKSSKMSRSEALRHLSMDELFHGSAMFRKKDASEVAADTMTYCIDILNGLGPLCTYEAAKVLSEQIDKHKRKRFRSTEVDILTHCSNLLSIIVNEFENAVQRTPFACVENILPMEPFITKKAHVLLKDVLLHQKLHFEKTGRALHGIVFVQRRCTAVILSKLINLQVQADNNMFNGLRSEYVLGHGLDSNIRLADSYMKSIEQDKILKRFKNGEFNVLVATSVVEEGLDVRKCNLVVRFDGIYNYREYVQSKGRARAENSNFIVMANEMDVSDMKKQLKVMQNIEHILFLKCQEREQPTDEEIEKAHYDEIEEIIPQYLVASGARITHATAVALLHRYCANLPHDQYTNTNPTFRTFEYGDLEDERQYQVQCILPLNCNLPERQYMSCRHNAVNTTKQETLDICKRDVCMKICKLLHEHGELDDEHLLPVTNVVVDDDEDNDGDDDDGDKKVKEGTKKSRQVYQRKIPNLLSPARFDVHNCDLYAISMTLTDPYDRPSSFAHWNLWYAEDVREFGIFLPKGLPKMEPIQLYTNAGGITVNFVKIPFLYEKYENHQCMMEKFHQKIFSECAACYTLGDLKFDLNDDCVSKSLIVPLKSAIASMIQSDRVVHINNPIDTELLQSFNKNEFGLDIDFRNCVVRKTYGDLHQTKRTYYVLDYSTTKAMDQMNGSKKSFVQYYMEKYQKCVDGNTNLLEVVGTSVKVSYEEDQTYKESKKRCNHNELLVPSLCQQANEIPVDMHLRMQLLPHILYRIECATCANLLNVEIAEKIDTRDILKVQKIKISAENTDENQLFRLLQKSIPILPTNNEILQCLTTKQAKFGFDLERLEMLGDSFLKQAITVFLYFKYSNEGEGKLTTRRKNCISNKNLSRVAKRIGLQNIICNSHLSSGGSTNQNHNPATVWLPPFYKRVVTNENVATETGIGEDISDIAAYSYQEVQDKSLADCVEALIGAYFNKGGINTALQFMQKYLHLDVLYKAIDQPDMERIHENTNSHYADFPLTKSVMEDEIAEEMFSKMKMNRFEMKVNHSFKDRSHLVRALTHLSYSSVTEMRGCYQEYEFLGDAILDFLVTSYVYMKKPNLSPGELTSLRSALVNNNTFALLAIKFDFQKFLFQESPSLFYETQEFVRLVQGQESQEDQAANFENPFVIVPRGSETGYHAPKVLGDLFESVAGAIFLDSGCDIIQVWRVYYPLMKPVLDKYMADIPLNPARELQERFTDAKLEFTQLDQQTICTVVIPGKQPITGMGKNKKIAKSTAAKRTLDIYLK